MTRHQKRTAAGDRQWEIDISVLGGIARWVNEFPSLLRKDLEEMQKNFPTWFLVFGDGNGKPLSCPIDGEYIVPQSGKASCLQCGNAPEQKPETLVWVGLIPVPVSGARRVESRLRKMIGTGEIPQSYTLDHPQTGLLLFAPIRIVYPSSWPNEQPLAYYGKEFLTFLGHPVSLSGHSSHMLGNQQLCLFSQWRRLSVCQVLQNRVVPHALAIVKLANGERPDPAWFNA